MAWDWNRQAIVLHGGIEHGGSYLSNTWAWDGVDWTPITTTPAIPRAWHRLVFDEAGGGLMMHAGRDSSAGPQLSSSWWLGGASLATATSFGSGCGLIPSGTPELSTNLPYVGNESFLKLEGANPASPCAFLFASAPTSIPLGPCTLYLQDSIATIPTISGVAGAAFPIAMGPHLLSTALETQAITVDPTGTGALGLAFSQGQSLVVGY